jgi:hypothetical protein
MSDVDLRSWLQNAMRSVDVDRTSDDDLVRLILSLAGEAAHNIVRPAAPLATFALGVAVAQHPDQSVEALAKCIADAARSQGASEEGAA